MKHRWISLALAVVLTALPLTLTACGLPHQKADESLEKSAVSRVEAEGIFDRHRKVRQSAYSLLSAPALTTIESGPVLRIDAGAIRVHQLLGNDAPADAIASKNLAVSEVYSPTFDAYPLWFVAIVRDKDRDLTRAQVYVRSTAASPWTLVASPEVTSENVIPALAHDSDGAIETVRSTDSSGLGGSPEEVVEEYAKTLDDIDGGDGRDEGEDGFIDRMREVAVASSSINGVTFSQTWKPHDVRYAIRTEDGGALVFATFTRDDDYRIKDGVFVNWPKGSEQKAFLSNKLFARGKLRYYHQVLLYVPPEGDGDPHAIGQYGGIVDGDGY